MQAALETTWPYVEEIFDPTDIADQLAALPEIAVDPSTLRAAWADYVRPVLAEATLAEPQPTWRSRGGRRGLHTEHLGHLLAGDAEPAPLPPGGDMVMAYRDRVARCRPRHGSRPRAVADHRRRGAATPRSPC